jgi:PBSX family phage portal protein
METAMAVTHNNANQKAVSRVTARVIGELEIPVEKRAGISEVVPTDPFHELAVKGEAIEPPFDMMTLAMLPEHSSEMEQCIEAMEVNIDGFGHRFVPRLKKDSANKASKKLLKAINDEKVRLVNFFQYCTRESFIDFRKRLRKDLETTGNAYFEVIRSDNGNIQGFTHVPSYQMRLGRIDDEHQLVERKILELKSDGSVGVAIIKEHRRFRKYLQSKTTHLRTLSTIGGGECRWFKEFGDPREYDARTGEKFTGKKGEIKANEMIHMKLYSARTPYGLPRYIGNLLSIFGDRAAEEINYITFRNNNIPSMVVLVSNGQLTEGSIERVKSFVESQIQGSDNYSKFLLLEAEGTEEGEESGAHTKVEIKPLTETQHRDALFQNYSQNNKDNVRRVWRLPPIYVGRADDYTRATAESSRVLADEQVFAPERETFDQMMNRILFPEMGIVFHQYRSNSPNTTDNQQMVKIISGSEKTGGMTPRIARRILEDMLSVELPEFPVDFPADVPFSLTMAEAVKNQADPAEPGQQVTALKRLWDDEEDSDVVETQCEKCGHHQLVAQETGDPVTDRLVALNRKLEKRLQKRIEDDRNDD